MEIKEKQYYKDKLAICLMKFLDNNKLDQSGDDLIIKSLRNLESASGVSYPIIQKISKGERNPNLTTLISIADGLEVSVSKFFQAFDEISDKEVKDFQKKKTRYSKEKKGT